MYHHSFPTPLSSDLQSSPHVDTFDLRRRALAAALVIIADDRDDEAVMPGDISSKLCALRPCTENGGALVEHSLPLQSPGQGRDGGAGEHHGRKPPDKPQPGPQPRELLRNLEDKAESRDKQQIGRAHV